MGIVVRVSRLEIQVANACNLTCESCSHFSNNGHRGVLRIDDAHDWMNGWDRRLAPVHFCLLGGEPTINPRLTELVYLAKRHWPRSQLWLTTNGFFLNKHPDLGKALHQTNTIVRLTAHDRSPEYAEQFNEIASLLADWRSQHPFGLLVEESWKRWTRRHHGFGQHVLPFSDQNRRASWENCVAKLCRQLFRGRLWKCSPIAYLQLQKETYPQISQQWDPYLAYHPLERDCSDDELVAFLRREDEEICQMCPAYPERFVKKSPLIPLQQLREESQCGQ